MHVVPGCGPFFLELERVLQQQFLPPIFGVEMSPAECDLFALPLRFGGLGVANPVSVASSLFESSVRGTVTLVQSITGTTKFELDAHLETVSGARIHYHKYMDTIYTVDFDKLLSSFESLQQRAILRAREHHISSWLFVVPLERNQFDLSAQEFRDGLALRYKKPLLCFPLWVWCSF